MIIKVLAENTAVKEEYGCEHGLSLYLETEHHRLLFDAGKSDLFLRNAEKMGVDISAVDTAVLSHGHYDHGGGLAYFLKNNAQAPLYIHHKAFGEYFARRPSGTEYIGLDKSLLSSGRIRLTGDFFEIDRELSLFADVAGRELPSLSNKALLMGRGEEQKEDTFAHEQNLVIREGGKAVLLAGCAHRGIVNIAEGFYRREGRYADAVVGGFHLHNPSTGKSEDPELIGAIAQRLESMGSRYYTCHCTGLTAYGQLKKVLGDQISYLATGTVVEI